MPRRSPLACHLTNGFEIQVTQTAEAQSNTGHDTLPFYNWEVQTYADKLEPVDDVIQNLSGQLGKYSPIHEYLAKTTGHWAAVPSSTGTLNLTCCGRIAIRAVQRSIHLGDKGESAMQQLGKTCEPV